MTRRFQHLVVAFVLLGGAGSAVAERVWLDASVYSGSEDYLRGRVDTNAANASDVPADQVLETLYEFEITLARSGSAEFSAQERDEFIRTSSKMFASDDWPIRADITFDADRLACFEGDGLLRCIVMLGMRKAAFPEEVLEDKEFLFTQYDYVLEILPGGELVVQENCFDGECYAVERNP